MTPTAEDDEERPTRQPPTRSGPRASGRTPRGGPPPRRRRRRRPVPFIAVPIAVVLALLAAEAGARWVGPEIPRLAGAEERVYLKADRLWRSGDEIDVVFLGASETAAGLIPSVVDEQVDGLSGFYNAALLGAPPSTNGEWFRRVVDPAASPDVAVLGLLPMTVSRFEVPEGTTSVNVDAYETAFDIIDPGGLGSWGWRLRQHSALIRHRGELRQPSLLGRGMGRAVADLLGRSTEPEPQAPGAGLDAEKETDPAVIARSTAPTGEVLEYRSPSVPLTTDPIGAALFRVYAEGTPLLEPLAGLVADIRAAGTVPVIVVPPVDRLTLEASELDMTGLDRIIAALVSWAAEHDVPILESFSQRWDRTLFHDRNHLAADGATRWSTEVGTWLDELCRAGQLGSACAR